MSPKSAVPREARPGFDPYAGATNDTAGIREDGAALTATVINTQYNSHPSNMPRSEVDRRFAIINQAYGNVSDDAHKQILAQQIADLLNDILKSQGMFNSKIGRAYVDDAFVNHILVNLQGIGKPSHHSIFGSITHAISSIPGGLTKIGNAVGTSKVGKFIEKETLAGAKLVVDKGLPIIQTAIKNLGPIGMVASGALGAMRAGLSGKGIEDIAWAAAEGAAPSGIDRAISAAQDLRHGKNVLSTAVSVAQSQLLPGSHEELGFNTAVTVLKQEGSKAALGLARRNLPTEGAKRAFDAAVGVVSAAANKGVSNPFSGATEAIANKGATMVAPLLNTARGLTSVSPVVSRVRGVLSPYSSNLQTALTVIKRNPTIAAQSLPEVARMMGTSQAIAAQAMAMSNAARVLPWRSLSARGANFVARYARGANRRMLTHDTSGLDSTGAFYIVEPGDNPSKIAGILTGSQGRYVELFAANPQYPTVTQNGVKNFKQFFAGMKLALPASWIKSAPPAASPVGGLPPVPAPSIAPTAAPILTSSMPPTIRQGSTGAAVVKAQQLLGVTADGIFGPITDAATRTFQRSKGLQVDGIIGPQTWTALLANTNAPVTSTPSIVPSNAPNITASIVQGKSILVAWSKTDGANQGGPSDYGVQPADLSTTFGPRDSMVDMAFQNWSNKNQGTNLPVSGQLDAATLTALQNWAETKAAQVSAIPGLPSATPSPVSPAVPGLPAAIPGLQLPGTTPPASSTPSAAPSTAPTADNSATPKVTPAGTAAKPTSIAPILVGGIGGAMLFGPVGAVVGAGLGAAVA